MRYLEKRKEGNGKRRHEERLFDRRKTFNLTSANAHCCPPERTFPKILKIIDSKVIISDGGFAQWSGAA